MRTLRHCALGAILLLGLTATQAHAVSSVELQYVGGSSVGPPVGMELQADISDTLSFDVVVQVDSAGIGGIGFDIQFETAEVNYSSANWITGSIFVSFAPFTSVNTLEPTGPVTPAAGLGRLKNLGFFGLPPNPTSTQVFLGSVVFHVTEADPTTLAAGFFSTDGSDATNASGTFITPDFDMWSINAPAPGATLSMLAGLGTLALLSFVGRRK